MIHLVQASKKYGQTILRVFSLVEQPWGNDNLWTLVCVRLFCERNTKGDWSYIFQEFGKGKDAVRQICNYLLLHCWFWGRQLVKIRLEKINLKVRSMQSLQRSYFLWSCIVLFMVFCVWGCATQTVHVGIWLDRETFDINKKSISLFILLL